MATTKNIEVTEVETPVVEEAPTMVLDRSEIRGALEFIRAIGSNEFPGTLLEAFVKGEEQYILDVAKVIGMVQKIMSDLKSHHDELFDRRAGFASEKLTKVVRLRQKSEKVGRPKGNKVDTLLADF